ncbi:bifunctional diguanylate cyclase/phosphodiesterase [Ureibacillus manganicus]|uniref:Diguanylate cyclase n=1 Tax=Ureibacillus manganicus DSM 26584 TaxID=1384049 RepID=A0A0A3I3K2_9BACL|nr:bifunctional diguanylate cyclase/phosphodiesterase [Ureibacillus manganicus]KGR79371.1 diguanylate cyclase [Ureibacillus manganicus DSM 26584]
MELVKTNYRIDDQIILNSPFPSFVMNKQHKLLLWNQLCEDVFQHSFNEFKDTDNIKTTLLSTIPEQLLNLLSDHQDKYQFENIQLLTKDENLLESSIITIPSSYDGELCTLVVCFLNDELRKVNTSTQELIDLKKGLTSTYMFVAIDDEGFIINCNQKFLKTSHWTPKRVIGKTFWQLFPETEEGEEAAEKIWKTITSGNVWHGEVEKITKDGQSYWVHLIAIPTYSSTENRFLYNLIEHDITEEKLLKDSLEKIAYVDPETGLMNHYRLEQVVNENIENGLSFSFVYLSIDKFYTLKEIHNIQIENNFITEFVKRMKIYFQDSSMARINSNEFVILTPLSEWFIQGFLHYLKQNPIYIGNVAVPISISGSITHSPKDQSNFTELMKASIKTIQTVREAGGNNISSLSATSHKALHRKSMIEKRLLLALDQKHLEVLYQPQFDLSKGKIIGVEALVRWEDEEIGVVSPDELIPIAEETGLINNIGSFVIEKACKQAVEWFKKGLDLKISINLSVHEFRDKNMAKTILNTLSKTGCPAHLIQIEITEKFALEAEAEANIIKQMRLLENEGIVFILDDFGTGYASFRYMQLLPIEILKIDHTFIHSLMMSEKNQKLVNGIVQFGKSMNITVLAEGVETEEQREVLKNYGCDLIQGYLISKPVNVKEIENIVS